MLTAKRMLDNLTDHMVRDIMELSDEEVVQEMIEDGEDPDEVAAHFQKIIAEAIEKGPADES